jgi:hypothetical protein
MKKLQTFAEKLFRLIATGSTKEGNWNIVFPTPLSFEGLSPMMAKELSTAEQEVIILLQENQILREELAEAQRQLLAVR